MVVGVVGGIAWIAKLVVMALQGGPDPDSIPENVFFFTGLAGIVVASGATAAHLARTASWWLRALAALAGVVVTALVFGLVQGGLTALPGESWVQEEAVFGIAGLVALGTALAALRAGARRPASGTP